MDKDEDACLDTHFVEADQNLKANFELARENVLKILDKVIEHEAAVQELQEQHAAGKVDPWRLKQALEDHKRIMRRLNQSQGIFSQRADELQKLLGLSEK
jgi:hypothetical protein